MSPRNHPGLYDALALFAAAGRDDLAVIAAARDLLFALPHVRRHLLSAPPDVRAGLVSRARADLVVVPAIVSGVVSLRARALAATLAGRAGSTDAFVPLLQLTLPGFGDVDVRVTFGPEQGVAALGERPSVHLHDALERLAREAVARSRPPGARPAEPLR